MKWNVINYFMITFCTPALAIGQLTTDANAPANIIKEYLSILSSRQNVSYTVDARKKYFDSNDTINMSATVYLKKNSSDSIFKGLIWFSVNDSIYKLYDANSIYYINKAARKVMQYDKSRKSIITGNVTTETIWHHFLDQGRLKQRIENAKDIIVLKDTLIDKVKCKKLLLLFSDEPPASDISLQLYISVKDKIPLLSKFIGKFQNNYQYGEFRLKDFSFEEIPDSRFSVTQIPSDYSIEVVKITNDASPDLLTNGTIAPSLNGTMYREGITESIEFANKVTLLDFWYMSCFPCIKSFPHLENLKKKFGDKLRIIGVNSIDNKAESIKKMPDYLQHNIISYPILLTTNEITTQYRVSAWPTIYIVDRNGKIVFSKAGFSEDMEQVISGIISELIK